MSEIVNEKRFIRTLGPMIIEEIFAGIDISGGAASDVLTIVSNLTNPLCVTMFPINGVSSANNTNSVIKLNGKVATFKSGLNTTAAETGQTVLLYPEVTSSPDLTVWHSVCIQFIQMNSGMEHAF